MKRSKFLNVEKVVKDTKKLLTETHYIKQVKSCYDYKGVDITHDKILCSNPTIKESLKKESIGWMLEEHGRDMLDIIILKIFQLGYQQGIVESEIETQKKSKLLFDMQNAVIKEFYKK